MNINLREHIITVFDIPPKAFSRAMLMQAYIFLIIFTLLIVKPTANSLFLSAFGVEQLPYLFILVAIVAAVVSSIYARLLHAYSLHTLIKGTLHVCVFSLLTLFTLLYTGVAQSITLYSFYLWVMIFAVLTTSQFWLLANKLFTSREAKKLFGFIGAGAITGGILGGYSTSILTNMISSELLLLVGAICLLPCYFILNRLRKIEFIRADKLRIASRKNKKKSTKATQKHPLFLILQSRHLTYLAAIIGLSVLIAKLIDYQFSGMAAAHYPDTDQLTAFFGFWFSTFNVLSLILQLFLTRRIMKNVGVSRALFLLPLGVLFMGLLLLVMPEILLVAIGLKMMDASLKQSVHKAAIELIILPVPLHIKNPSKIFIDVFVDSFATGISGLLLLFVVKGMDLPATVISSFIVGLTVIWLIMVYRIRRAYLSIYKTKLTKGILNNATLQPLTTPKEVLIESKSVQKQLLKTLDHGSERQILSVLRKFKKLPNIPFFKRAAKLLKHPSATVRAAVLKKVNRYDNAVFLEEAALLLNDKSEVVQARAMAYIIEHDQADFQIENIEDALEHPSFRVQGVGLTALAILCKDNPILKAEFQLDARLVNWYQNTLLLPPSEQKEKRVELFLKMISKGQLSDYYHHIDFFLDCPVKHVRQTAITAAGGTKKEVYLNQLIDYLKDVNTRKAAQKGLGYYKDKAIPVLIEVVKNPTTDVRILRAIPAILKNQNTQQVVDFLFLLLKNKDKKVRQNSMRALNRIRFRKAQLDFHLLDAKTLLLDQTQEYHELLTLLYKHKILSKSKHADTQSTQIALQRKLKARLKVNIDNNLEQIFLILGLKYSPEDMLTIYKGVRCKKRDLQNNALEFLDNILNINLKKIILPLIETALLDNLTEEHIRSLQLVVPNEKEFYQKIIALGDPKLLVLVEELLKTYPEGSPQSNWLTEFNIVTSISIAPTTIEQRVA